MNAEWYCQAEGAEHGPMTAEQLRGFARDGRLGREGLVRKGLAADWVSAGRVKGLFEDGPNGYPVAVPVAVEEPAPFAAGRETPPPIGSERLARARSIQECISAEERKKRFGTAVVNTVLWLVLLLLAFATMGTILVIWLVGWAINRLFAEYNVRKLMAYGTTATPGQFPEIARALDEVCQVFGVKERPRVVVIDGGGMLNAFAIKFAKKKVIVLLSEALEGVLEKPEQLRFLLGHELAHVVLDHGARGIFEIYKPASYRAAREMTCDNAGAVAAGDLESAKTVLKRLGVGNRLYNRLDDGHLQAEARYIYSGITGWLLKQYLTYPSLGKRIDNVARFSAGSKPYR